MNKPSLLFISQAIAVSLLVASAAEAGTLASSAGNPTGPSTASGSTGGATLDPAGAVYLASGNSPWIVPALAAEGFSAANGWTIQTVALVGNDISLGAYQAWADVRPAISQGFFTFPTDPNWSGYGGAELGLGYANHAPADPNPSSIYVNWIQVIETNQPTAFGIANGVSTGDGWYAYIDNGYAAPSVPNNPFYGGLSSGGGGRYAGDWSSFVDIATRPISSAANWRAQVFLATWSPVNAYDHTRGGSITLYDGVSWGFDLYPAAVPEPSTAALCAAATIVLVLSRYRRPRFKRIA